MIFTSVLFT